MSEITSLSTLTDEELHNMKLQVNQLSCDSDIKKYDNENEYEDEDEKTYTEKLRECSKEIEKELKIRRQQIMKRKLTQIDDLYNKISKIL